ncbi:DUF4136 domain-containing protein [Pontibacter sp. Tf4]|uniref:DUF4136 domain-containing protein n=1 Tax=Pontibacter sp. Tf4 TaxID=2761620 RepID=UPI0016235AC9|nr:DUF4136 domain-containing protein [Pontibacter sp. Tf4]MBB6610350.1 DUF4136 domain-containing protein [Pontibacter sp. Tf4]
MKKRTIVLFFYLPVLLLLSGCVASSVSSKPNAVLATGALTENLQSFAWFQEQPAAPAAYDEGYSAALDKHIRTAIETELQKKGFTKAASGNADVLIAYDVSVSVPLEKDIAQAYLDGFGYSYAYMAGYRYNYKHSDLPGYRAVDLYKSGTLIVDMIDPKTKELVWRGWTEGAFSNFKVNYKTVLSEVEKLLAPVRSR